MMRVRIQSFQKTFTTSHPVTAPDADLKFDSTGRFQTAPSVSTRHVVVTMQVSPDLSVMMFSIAQVPPFGVM
jgi:hypothetical protein